MLKIGFTGTQRGMTLEQRVQVENLMSVLCAYHDDEGELHHGDCIGADAQAHEIATRIGIRTVIHPPVKDAKRAWCNGDLVLEARDYLDRNHDIVDGSEILIAGSGSNTEELRSGTWATVRYARRKNKVIYIVYPNGNIQVQE